VQNSSSDTKVIWTHADLLTGSKQEVTKTGAPAGGIKAREEYEPLGQTISTIDPAAAPEPEPPNEPSPVGSASEPEWQCQVPLEFQPYHCQKRAEIANSLNGTGIQTIYDPEKKPGDPNFIHAGDRFSSGEREAERADDRLRTQTLHATTKPVDVSHDGAAIQPSSVPSGGNDGDVDYENSIVTVRDGPSLPADFLDASVSRQQVGVKEKLNERDQKRFEEERAKLPKRPEEISQKCKDLLARLNSINVSVTDILKAIADQQPYDGNRSTISIKDAQVLDPLVEEKPSESYINTSINVGFVRGNFKAQASQIYAEVYYQSSHKTLFGRNWGGLKSSTIFHEALHSVTKRGDIRLAQALGLGEFSSSYDASLAITKGLKDNNCTE